MVMFRFGSDNAALHHLARMGLGPIGQKGRHIGLTREVGRSAWKGHAMLQRQTGTTDMIAVCPVRAVLRPMNDGRQERPTVAIDMRKIWTQ